MHKNGLIVTLRTVNNQILREYGNDIFLPFGSEYVIGFRNQNSERLLVSVFVNGKDALDGERMVLSSYCSEEILQGFFRRGRISHRFKFIEKTQRIRDYSGDNPNDGTIRIEFWKEIGNPNIRIKRRVTDSDLYKDREIRYKNCLSEPNRGFSPQTIAYNMQQNDQGLTVPGSEINEEVQFTDVGFIENNSTVIFFYLRGENNLNSQKIKEPVLTKSRLICQSCGHRNIPGSKCCNQCGTSLTF